MTPKTIDEHMQERMHRDELAAVVRWTLAFVVVVWVLAVMLAVVVYLGAQAKIALDEATGATPGVSWPTTTVVIQPGSGETHGNGGPEQGKSDPESKTHNPDSAMR